MATLISHQTLTALSGTLTVPEGTGLLVLTMQVHEAIESNGIASITLGEQSLTLLEHGAVGDPFLSNGGYCVATLADPPTGEGSLTITYENAISPAAGPVVLAHYLSAGATVRDSGADGISNDNDPASVTIDSEAGDLVLVHWGQWPDLPPEIDGVTGIGTVTHNNYGVRYGTVDAPGASSTTVGFSGGWPIVLAVSLYSDGEPEPEPEPEPESIGASLDETGELTIALSGAASMRVLVDGAGIGVPRDASVAFFSGHSAADEPLPTYVGLLAASAQVTYDYQRQHINGSPIRVRTVGNDPDSTAWEGYSLGANRSGEGLNLIEHFRDVSAGSGKETAAPYTALITMEGPGIASKLAWERTVPLLRHQYELVREGSPNCEGYLFPTGSGPRRTGEPLSVEFLPTWIAYARATNAANAAVCSRINASLALEGRSDRLMLMPTYGALAEVIERATADSVPGITGDTPADTVDIVFDEDGHHLTDVGRYLCACVVFGVLYRRDPRGLAYPETVTATQAESLQVIAWDVLVDTYGTDPLGPQYSPADAKQAIVDYIPHWDAVWSVTSDDDPIDVSERQAFFSGASSDMHFDAETDSGVWLEPPPGGAIGVELSETGELSVELGGVVVMSVGVEGAGEDAPNLPPVASTVTVQPKPTTASRPRLTIRAGDTDVIEISVTPADALEEGTRVRARLWFGRIDAPSWAHDWDTDEGGGVEIAEGKIRIATSVIDWAEAPKDRALQMTLAVKLSRGSSGQTLPYSSVSVLPQAIV